jgi:hypothetical protein
MPTPRHRVLQPSSRVASVVTHRRRVRRARRDAHRPRPSPENLPRHYFHPSSRRPRRHRRALRRHPARRRRRHPASPSASRGATRASPRACESASVRARRREKSREVAELSREKFLLPRVREVRARSPCRRSSSTSTRRARSAGRRAAGTHLDPTRADPIDPFRSIDRSTLVPFSIDRL